MHAHSSTSPFLHGLRSWSVSICLLEKGRPVLGYVYEPCADQLYWAGSGQGAFCDDRPIKVDPAARLHAGLTAVGAGGGASRADQIGNLMRRLLEAGGTYMRNGSAALSLAHVAAGHYVGFYEPSLSAWDCAAGLLIVSEAGGVADDFFADGDILKRQPVFAAAPGAEPELRRVVCG
jgi:myo-inositol-1(or 4)-monophosphatase